MLYGRRTYLETVWTHTGTRPVWLAQYYSGPYMIWQCSESGRIDGINGNADLEISYTAIRRLNLPRLRTKCPEVGEVQGLGQEYLPENNVFPSDNPLILSAFCFVLSTVP